MDQVNALLSQALVLLVAAQAILQKASSLLKNFVTANTPESALLAALATVYQGWSTGNIPTGAAIVMAFSALMTFAIAESSKDRVTP